MNSERLFFCPQCGGSFIVISEERLYCLRCRLTFLRSVIEKIGPENVIADEDLESIVRILVSDES